MDNQRKYFMLPVYVINLDRDTDRWTRIESSFQGREFNLIRVPGIDVSCNAQYCTAEFYDSLRFERQQGRKATHGEIGCYYSHLKAMETFLKSDAPHAIICEDDIYPLPQAERIIQDALNYASHWDLLRLARCRSKGFVPLARLTNNIQIGTNIKGFAYACAYMVNRHVAEFFLKTLTPMSLPWDLALYAGFNEIKEMSLVPGTFDINETSDNSSIGNNRKSCSPLNWKWWTAIAFKFQARKRRYTIQKKRIEELK